MKNNNIFTQELIHYEPKRMNRFRVEFPKLKSFVITEIEHPKILNGKWQPISMKLIDLIGPSTSQCVFSLLNTNNDRSFFQKLIGKPMFSFKIYALDPTGVEIEEWIIDVKNIKSIDFGTNNYTKDEVTTIKLVITPQNCTLRY